MAGKTSLIKSMKKLSKNAAEELRRKIARDKAIKKANKDKKPTQKGLKLSKNKDIKMPDRDIETPVVVGRTGITKTGEKINVGSPQDITRTVGSKAHAERKVLLQNKKDKGNASKNELAELAARKKADDIATSKQQGGSRPPKKVPDGEYFNKQTGQIINNPKFQRELTKGGKENSINNWTKDATPNEVEAANRNRLAREETKSPKDTAKELVRNRMRMPKNKGGSITKNRMGINDYRKGGYVLSSVDNRKNKGK